MSRCLALSLVMLVALGCAGQPAPPSPAEQPGTPTAVASPVTPPAAPETATPGNGATPAIDHPTGATDVVLRMSITGGFLYPGTGVDWPPVFTLYGDGRVIYTLEEPLPSGALRRTLHEAHLDETQVAALLESALGAGGLATARERYADVPIADATTTNFHIDAAGVRKTVAVYALGDYDEPGSDAAARASFERLADALHNFGSEVEAGNAEDLGPYAADAYRVTIFPLAEGELPPTANWPWPTLDPEDFETDNSGFGRLVMEHEQAQAVADLPAGDMGDPVVVGPDGATYLIRARPLLPDEEP